MASEPEQQIAAALDIRPSVARTRKPLPPWLFFVTLALIAVVLFVVLDGRRRALQAPAVAAGQVDLSGGSAAPMLYIPPDLEQAAPMTPPAPPVAIMPERPSVPLRPVPPPAPSQSPPVQAYFPPTPAAGGAAPAPKANSSAPVLVIDNGGAGRLQSAPRQAGQEGDGGQAAGAGASARVPRDTSRQRAGAFANRSTSVVQGTLIPAVLESALDSTRPGFVRAIVSRDVRGFDGTKVLIPRGSRLIGEYESDAQSGENRALINWTRLIRPDGATVAIDSPAADPLGRNGVRARVNSHFLERFGGAILQSVLDIGVNAAARAVDSPTVIALPGSFGGAASQRIQPQQVTPTLTVKRGTSISIFVARDLDFTGVEQGRR
ncbi:MAG: conjugal transfer protein TrbI [Blastomonas fulva]|uniref:TrbI/VirB10 family protein n=1 Tax=Blastomonas fulva TaxID=1550728 RepID=UPI0024E1AB7E|nr:TrbI/VirB10 family protein [Blastomonas fulva]MDK2756129.1 conjugal transfer protein TrbI [Blastomonas fulva]